MKNLRGIILTALVAILGGAAFAETMPILPGSESSIREVTLAQIFRYGREMYRYGNYPEAVQAFKQMLAIDCNSEVAQYHLMKISRKSPEYKDLETYLKNLPCPVHNFDEEDFLPASLYSESDPELMQEQLIFYNKRYRIAKASLIKAANNYGALTQELEDEITSLRKQLTSSDGMSSAETTAINQRISAGVNAAARMDSQVSQYQDQLSAERQKHQDELIGVKKELARYPSASLIKGDASYNDDQTVTIMTAKDENITELKESLAREKTGTARPANASLIPSSPTPVSQAAVDVTRKIENARAQLKEKERALEAKDRELSTLQEKFEDIQRRLRLIQASVETKNTQIKTLQSDVNSFQR
jgi:Skp family chaperone for outer membrane proteins